MYKQLLILLCFIGSFLPSRSQEKAVVTIVHSDSLVPMLKLNIDRVLGNVHLIHKNMVMYCDSLYNHRDSNYLEAYGRVHVIQNDTLNLWGDFMNYNSLTQMVKVRDNVIMKDPQMTLTTNFLDYDAASRVGYYFNGGTLKDSINTLTSDIGFYYVPISEALFKDSVKVYSPQYTMFSDTLKYQTETKLITILGPTTIYGDNRTLYSENGWYNSLTGHAELYKNNRLTYNSYQGQADTIVVDSISGTAVMHRNIHLLDTVNNTIVEGNYGELLKNNDYAFVTQRAVLILVGQSDSLFIHGDTLSISKDSLGNNVMKAYFNTKFFSQELQGRCDSMAYPVADSTVYLYHEPIVWASGNQLTAADINMHIVNNKVDLFHLNNKAMIVNQLDSTMYNQIKGRNMTGHVRDNELYQVDVDGSGEALYYTDDQGVIFGLDKTVSSSIKISLKDRKVYGINFYNKVEGQLTPLFMIVKEDKFLKDFKWHIDKKPLLKEDIFKKD